MCAFKVHGDIVFDVEAGTHQQDHPNPGRSFHRAFFLCSSVAVLIHMQNTRRFSFHVSICADPKFQVRPRKQSMLTSGVVNQTGLGTKGFGYLADNPLKIRMLQQLALAGVGTSKSGIGTGKLEVIHVILSSHLTQLLQLF